jgi:hypothetical protein
MSGFRRLGAKAAGVLSAAIAALAVGALPAVQASAAVQAPASAVKVPVACKTFTAKSADAVFGVAKSKHLAKHSMHTGTGKNEVYTCTVTHSKKTLKVTTSAFAGGFGGPLKCFKRPKLGPDGQVCVSTEKSFPFSIVVFNKHKIEFSDTFTKTLPHQGKALYTFALAQYKAFKH